MRSDAITAVSDGDSAWLTIFRAACVRKVLSSLCRRVCKSSYHLTMLSIVDRPKLYIHLRLVLRIFASSAGIPLLPDLRLGQHRAIILKSTTLEQLLNVCTLCGIDCLTCPVPNYLFHASRRFASGARPFLPKLSLTLRLKLSTAPHVPAITRSSTNTANTSSTYPPYTHCAIRRHMDLHGNVRNPDLQDNMKRIVPIAATLSQIVQAFCRHPKNGHVVAKLDGRSTLILIFSPQRGSSDTHNANIHLLILKIKIGCQTNYGTQGGHARYRCYKCMRFEDIDRVHL